MKDWSLVFSVIIIFICLLWIQQFMTQRTYVLPKIAWMYWDTVDLPPLIDQIRRYNTGAFKGWDIRFLNQHMLDEYIKVWDYPAGYKELIPQHKEL